jgi:hypothetical protein
VYQQGLAAAQALRHNEQVRLASERLTAFNLVKAARAAHNPPLPPPTVPRKIVPGETADYPVSPVTADAITRYNTGPKWSVYHFDYHYVVSADNLQVITTDDNMQAIPTGRWSMGHAGRDVAESWPVAGSGRNLHGSALAGEP